MSSSSESSAEPLTAPPPRCLRMRYWFVGSVLLVLLLMIPMLRSWHRRHQLFQHFQSDAYGQWSLHKPFEFGPETLPRKRFPAAPIGPWDRLIFAALKPSSSNDLRLLTDEVDLVCVHVEFQLPNGGSDKGFEVFSALTHLEHVTIQHATLKSDGLMHLHALPKLRYLALKLIPPIDGIRELRSHPTLEELEISFERVDQEHEGQRDPRIASAVVDAVSGMPKLTRLCLTVGSPNSYDSLATNPELQSLELNDARLSKAHFESIARIRSLTELEVGACEIEDGALAGLLGSRISRLNLFVDRIPLSELLPRDLQLPQVTSFGSYPAEDDSEVAMLTHCFPNVTWLKLGDTASLPEELHWGLLDGPPIGDARGKITDAAVISIARLKYLQRLYLGCNEITDAAIEFLGRMKSLKQLDVRRARLSPAGIARLKELLPDTDIEEPVFEAAKSSAENSSSDP